MHLNSSYNLRKRKRKVTTNEGVWDQFLARVNSETKFLVFSGSGLSVDSGVACFTSRTGLYERARRQFNLPNGQQVFSFKFFKNHPREAQAFYAQLYEEMMVCRPGHSHQLLEALIEEKSVVRHYTMNIDGLSNKNTFPIHGNIRSLFCTLCGLKQEMTNEISVKLRNKKCIKCSSCPEGFLRSKIVLYGDETSEQITSEAELWSSMERDLERVQFVLWIGISFIQRASVDYFLKTWSLNQRLTHVVIDPDESVEFNLRSGLQNDKVEFLQIPLESGHFLESLTNKLHS